MLLEQQEKKLSAGKPPDGAKLSFKEKMKLFAQEVGFSKIQLYYWEPKGWKEKKAIPT